VGSVRGDRELMRLRIEYIGAVRQLAAAMRAFHAAQVPLDYGGDAGQPLPPWTPDQVRAVIAARDAWVRFTEARRAYDQSLPELSRYARRPSDVLPGHRKALGR
jgi:hypothetical protein